MPYALDLRSARLKLNQAERHLYALSQGIREKVDDGKAITLGREFDPKDDSIVIRIVCMQEVPEEWSPLFGDAAYNIRCALDHLAWQLAIRKFDGVEPTDVDIIKHIQFPVALTPQAWDSHVNRKHMLACDSDKLAKFQPFTRGLPNWSIHPLGVLCGKGGLQNIDKHRSLHLAYMAPHSLKLTGIGEPGENPEIKFTDCELRVINGHFEFRYDAAPRALKPGDEISRIPIVPTGPNPDVELNADLRFYVAVGEGSIPVLDVLIESGSLTEEILRDFS
jgi:hypothetical protein